MKLRLFLGVFFFLSIVRLFFPPQALAAVCGIDPYTASSGQNVGTYCSISCGYNAILGSTDGPDGNGYAGCGAGQYCCASTSDAETCNITRQVTKRSDGSFNLGFSVNTSQLNPGTQYVLYLDTGLSDTLAFPFNPAQNGFNGATNLDAGHAGQTFAMGVRRESCKELAGGSCAICTSSVTFSRDAEVVDVPDPNEISDEDRDAILPDQAEAAKIDKFNFCKQVPEAQRQDCERCVGSNDPSESEKLYTAVGCINTNGKGLAENLIQLMLGLGGGVALLSFLAAAFYLTTSQGDSGKVKEAKELITASVSGMFFIVFSIFVLQFIGVSILRIPGLGGS